MKMQPLREESVVIETCHTTVHYLGKLRKKKKPLRYMLKDGRFPVDFHTSPRAWCPYLTDIFTTLVECRWRGMFLMFFLSYILSWLFFGLCYWLIAHVHGDVDKGDDDLCVYNVRGFTSAFLFSMETQATIGYGFRGMSENCIVAIIVVTIQDVFSCLLDTIIIGIIIAKMASARKRAQTVGFSSCAVVNLRNGELCLSWRLGDFRGNHIVDGIVKAQLVRHVRQPMAGSLRMVYQNVEVEEREVVLATPATIIHKIDHNSPLYTLSPDELQEEAFEIVVCFTYTGDSTGMLHQTRTSYTPLDIRWGQRFQEMLKLGKKHYKVDYARFNETTWVPVPMISAEDYDRGRPSLNNQSQHQQFKAMTCSTTPDVIEVIQQTFL
ncbi:inward rectifier potassium channel 16-like [Periophthalmus magnuspinnatus]|uniref:inward rectifier potassium channel 16-like n=1 Tax=Periophthalmus magnuspinnatus TaxID=409849 RepID=UPI00145AE8BF|nr:inward rectifier potassium channel 16-like [Periophthalmus magnuspinnatus]